MFGRESLGLGDATWLSFGNHPVPSRSIGPPICRLTSTPRPFHSPAIVRAATRFRASRDHSQSTESASQSASAEVPRRHCSARHASSKRSNLSRLTLSFPACAPVRLST